MATQGVERLLGFRFWGLSLLYALGAALVIGLPTVLIPNHLFTRMLPSSPQDYVIWILSVLLLGPVLALATLHPVAVADGKEKNPGGKRAIFSTFLSFFSVGCPICNKLVVLLLGMSGAMTFFNPLRPFLGIASLTLLAVTLVLRIRVLRSGCPVML